MMTRGMSLLILPTKTRDRERGAVEAMSFCSSSSSSSVMLAASSTRMRAGRAMAAQKPLGTRKGSTVFPVDEPGPREARSNAPPVKLLTNVEKLRLLTKAEKAGVLSAAENFGLSLSTVEKFGLLSKAEELGVLSAATDLGTPGTLSTLGLGLLVLGPLCVYLVPEQHPWEVALQVVVALISVVGGSAAFAASNFVSNLQRSS